MGSEEAVVIIKDFESAEDLAGKIENEGLDYFFMEYLSPESIEDPHLRASVEFWQHQRTLAIARLRELGVEVE